MQILKHEKKYFKRMNIRYRYFLYAVLFGIHIIQLYIFLKPALCQHHQDQC